LVSKGLRRRAARGSTAADRRTKRPASSEQCIVDLREGVDDRVNVVPPRFLSAGRGSFQRGI
jgi:hypothetical protein